MGQFFKEMLETAEVIEDLAKPGEFPNTALAYLDNMLKIYAGTPANPKKLRLFQFKAAKVVIPSYAWVGALPFAKEAAYLYALEGFGAEEFYNVALVKKNPFVVMIEMNQHFNPASI